MLAMWLEMGRTLSWSSMTTHVLQDDRDRMNLEGRAVSYHGYIWYQLGLYGLSSHLKRTRKPL